MADAATGPIQVTIVLPRSLAALLPGTPRRIEARGGTLLEILDDADRQAPGLRHHVVAEGPAIRPHLNVFVGLDRASLDASIPDGAEVRIIPAVSGGAPGPDRRVGDRLRLPVERDGEPLGG